MNGHVNVKRGEDKSLNQFCYDFRKARNNPGKTNTLINEKRIASLDALGFDWRLYQSFAHQTDQPPTNVETDDESSVEKV